jgi:hypothetical protein
MWSTMDARNDVTIRGVALAEAMMSILPRTVAGELGTVLLRPGTELGTVLLDAFYAPVHRSRQRVRGWTRSR